MMTILDVRDQVLLLESRLKEKKDEMKRLEALDEEKNRLLLANELYLRVTTEDLLGIDMNR